MTYINMKTPDGVETVDEFPTRSEARKMLKEYNQAFNGAYLYTSQRATKEWKAK